jgi:PAS domain S-box-containing protein
MTTPAPARPVCIVDDDPDSRKLLRELLEPDGYRLMIFESGPEAIETARIEPPDIVILDVMMPEMDGFEVCRQLRNDEQLSQIPIILITSLDDRRSRLQGFEAGADDFISKPIDPIELRTRLGTIARLNRFRLLYNERERFRRAIANSPDAILITTPEGQIRFVNETAKNLFGTKDNDGLSGSNIYEALSPENGARLKSQVATLIERPDSRFEPLESTLLLPRCAGTVVEISAALLPWQDGSAVQLSLRDVTDKKNVEAQLLRSQRIEMLGQLASGMVHDLNNILTAIRSSVSLAEQDDPQRRAAHLRNADAQAHRGAGLLRQLLLFARGSDGQMRLVHTSEIIGEAVTIIQETFGSLYSIKLDLGDDLPDLHADSTQLHQVITNLCVNARDAMPAGGCLWIAAKRVAVTPASAADLSPEAKPGEYVALSVRDTGTGITPEVRAKLFNPFFTTKPAGKGTGLGLATVLRILRRHRGFVTVESKPGEGACFTCYFPAASASASIGS